MGNKVALEKAFDILSTLLGDDSDVVFTIQIHGNRGSVTVPVEISLTNLKPGTAAKVEISDRQTKIHFTV